MFKMLVFKFISNTNVQKQITQQLLKIKQQTFKNFHLVETIQGETDPVEFECDNHNSDL